MKITLPLPPVAVSPNARTHWAALAKAKSKMAFDAKIAYLAVRAEEREGVVFENPLVCLQAFCRVQRIRDRDNLIASCKAYIDGLQAAGLFANDSQVRWGAVDFDIHKTNPRLEITIEEF